MRFFDSSALAKRYIRAEGTSDVNRWLRDSRSATCRLTEAELSSAFARRVREGTMSTAARVAALGRLHDDLRRIHVVELAPVVVTRVHALLTRYALRAADSLQLAAALCLAEGLGRPIDFVVYDERLADAARAEQLRVLPGPVSRPRR
jgi:predicted nucleic acid-binding protein